MKNILLPTDLTVQSLWPIHNVVKDANGEKVIIHVVHMLHAPTSISDLLTIKEPYASVPANFTEAYQLLWNKYKDTIEKLEFNFIYGNSSRFVNNFIEGRNIDAVYRLENYNYAAPLDRSEKWTSQFKNCSVPVHSIPLERASTADYQILSVLLNDKIERRPATKTAKPTVSYI